MIIRTIRWPIVGVVGAVCMLLAGGAIFWAMHASSLKYTHGPLAKEMGTNADSSSIGVLVGQTVVLGGAPVMEQFTRLARYHAAKDAPYEVVAVRPTNLSSGIHVVKEAGLLIPPGLGIGTLEWANKVLHHKMQNLPIVRNHGAVEPILMVQPTKPGRYIIKGLFITYKWAGIRYTDYVPMQFVVCAATTTARLPKNGGCGANVPLPPLRWR